jgi:methylmalonyl-CoA mutase
MAGLSLASEFPAAGRREWEERALAALAGRSLDSLTHRTYDGIALEAVLPRAGGAVSLAGLRAGQGGWRAVQRIDMPDVAAANAQAREDVENGAGGLCLVLPGSVTAGRHGVAIGGAGDLARLFEGIALDRVAMRLDAGRHGRRMAELLAGLYRSRNIDLGRAGVSFCLDPLAAFALTGEIIGPEALARRMAETLSHLTEAGHRGDVFAADARVWHGAGASEAQELGLALAGTVAQLRLLEAGGCAPDEAAPRLAFVLSADADQFSTIAKFRALRLLWARLGEVMGLAFPAARVHGETSLRMMARRDPHVNLLRTTTAAFAAGIGGADSVTVLPFTAALGLPDPFARRLARNIQTILEEESGIGAVADAAAGSGHVEAMTRALAETAWEVFRTVEGWGGLLQALIEGRVQAMIAEVADKRGRDIAKRKLGLTGLSEFPDLGEKAVSVLDMELPAHWADGLAVESTEAGRIACTPLAQHRLGEAFEALRDAADAMVREHGGRPAVFLANLGRLADFNARATWMGNLLAAGGIAAIANEGFADVASTASAFRASGARLACLCGSDAAYAELAEPVARELKRAGAARVLLAGRSGEREAVLRAAGIDSFAHAGIDAVAFLEELQAAIAAPHAKGGRP